MNPSSYLCGFCQSPLASFTSKKNVEYVVCSSNEEEKKKEKKCPFFVKSILLKDYCFALLYSVKKIYKKNPPFCEHDNTSTLFFSQSKGNFNRPFFTCANGPGYDPCSYFQWADEEPNEFTVSQNHPSPGYIAQKPVQPPSPPPTKFRKKRKMELEFLPDVKRVNRTVLSPDDIERIKRKRKEFKANKKNKKETDTTVLQQGNVQDPGTPFTPQELLSIEQLLEANFD